MDITAIAFDFGTKSIGCAVGQSITGTAQALPAFKAQDGIPNWDAIEKCLKDWKPDVIVVGLPLNMDGTEQSRWDFCLLDFRKLVRKLFRIS